VHSNSLPPLPWLRAFEVSARHLSFTAAAQELALSQAAVSKQIKLLELKVGEPLFHRFPRSLRLTKAGEAFLPKVVDAFERLAAGASEVFGPRQSDVLTVRASVGFAVNWLAPRLPDFIARHPHVSLRLLSSVWNDDDAGEAFDFDIRYGDGHWPGVKSDRLTRESLTPVCSPAFLASHSLTNPNALAQHTLIHVLGYKEGWALWLKKAGVITPLDNAGIQVDTSLLAFKLAAAGAGVALGRTSMQEQDIKAGNLVMPFDLKVPIEEGFHLIASQIPQHPKHAKLFAQWLLMHVQ
jgi:LysR family transcriptional regulator, glycine cleavage system transcriptional activator